MLRLQERERLKQEKRDEKRLNKERKLELRRLELEMVRELNKPIEDLCLPDQKVLVPTSFWHLSMGVHLSRDLCFDFSFASSNTLPAPCVLPSTWVCGIWMAALPSSGYKTYYSSIEDRYRDSKFFLKSC